MLQLKNKKGDVLYEADVKTWEGHVFPKNLDLDDLYVEGNASFRYATFKGDASFFNATFKGNVSFNKATFKGYASFTNATFKSDVSFTDATFGKLPNDFPLSIMPSIGEGDLTIRGFSYVTT